MIITMMRFAHLPGLWIFQTWEWDVEETLAESRYWKRQVCDLKLHGWNLRQGDIETEVSP